MKIFCVIPAYNEEKTIVEVINSVRPLVNQVVVVNDGSSDKTFELAVAVESGAPAPLSKAVGNGAVVGSGAVGSGAVGSGAGAPLPTATTIIILRHLINRGQGAALKTGTQYAIDHGADIIVHFDADGQFLASDIKKVVEPIKNGIAEAVFGSRFLNQKSRIPFFKKNLILPLAKIVSRIFFNIKMTDPQSGFRALTAGVARKIDWQQDGMAHCSEILFAVNQAGCKIKEVPITVIYHSFGQRFSGGFKILKDLFFARLMN